MGVPFEALIPYGIMLGVSNYDLDGEEPLLSRNRCSESPEQASRRLDICRTAERELVTR